VAETAVESVVESTVQEENDVTAVAEEITAPENASDTTSEE
jgi:hypothetical protein